MYKLPVLAHLVRTGKRPVEAICSCRVDSSESRNVVNPCTTSASKLEANVMHATAGICLMSHTVKTVDDTLG